MQHLSVVVQCMNTGADVPPRLSVNYLSVFP